MVVDSHCHLDSGNFKEGPDAVIERARHAGVRAFIAIGVGSAQAAHETVELSRRRREVLATVGVHPHEATGYDATWPSIEPLFEEPRVVAVGETGLDFHYDHSPRAEQEEVFRRQIAFARERRLPLVIHTRSAGQRTLEILESERARDVGGVMHCFSEDRSFAARALDLGFYLSFSGIVTFKNARSVHEVASWAPTDRVLVETDSPYLAPVPLRGRRCEPAYVVHTAARVAELRSTSPDGVARITTENACRLFGSLLADALEVGQNRGNACTAPTC